MLRSSLATLLCAGAAYAPAALAAESYVWWEAEDPVSETFPPQTESPFRVKTLQHPDRLSGGDWISGNRGNTGEPYSATYRIEVPADGTYSFWVRKCWHHALFTWEFDDGQGPSGEVDRRVALVDSVELRPKVSANWVDLGQIELAAGAHTFSFTQTGTDSPKGGGFFGIDCFALMPFAWSPNGKLRPGEKTGLSDEGWTAFEPSVDPFTDEALVDLRDRNHVESGAYGRAILRDGDLYWEDAPDQRVRFWGQVIGGSPIIASDLAQEQYIRRMAKLGVNMIRLHGAFHGGVEGDPLAISDDYLERFDHFVATCKKHGVYFMVNTWYDKWLKGRDVGAGYAPGKSVNCWQFIHPEGRALWKQWTTRLFDRENPYTGMRNADDPTIAIVQLSNENNYFFHAFQPYSAIPLETMVHMEDRFAEWLSTKYGSVSKAFAAWGESTGANSSATERDDPDAGRAGIMKVHFLQNSGQRGRDTAAFLVHDYRSITDGFIAHLREIGYDGLINNGNWLSADAKVLEPLDKLANVNAEVMSRHGVNLHSEADLDVFYAIRKGDQYRSVSSLFEPWRYPVMEVHYDDRASMVCEPKASNPNRFRAEWPVVISAWGALQSMDVQVHFAGSIDWVRSNSGQLWGIDSPVFMGQAPVCALIYRKGYIDEAPVVIDEHLHVEALTNLEGAAFGLVSVLNADEIQPEELKHLKLDDSGDGGLNPLALMIGSMQRTFVDQASEAGFEMDPRVAEHIDIEGQQLTTIGGQLHLDWGEGLLQLRAPKAQGAVGFLKKAGAIELPDLIVDCDNEYASIVCVPLDDRPLAESERILLSVVTEEQDYGYQTEPATFTPRRAKQPVEGVRITELGRGPIQHREPSGTVRFKRADAAQLTVTAVDWNGYPVAKHGSADAFALRGDVIHYVVHK